MYERKSQIAVAFVLSCVSLELDITRRRLTGYSATYLVSLCRSIFLLQRSRSMAESVDYLVVGAGATGMAFLDTLLKHHPGPRPAVAVVDRRAAPGGHWNDGYPYVTLHQAARNYGVESVAMEDGVADRKELRASRVEILDYYGKLMERFVGEQGVRYIPNAAYNFSTGVCEVLDGASACRLRIATLAQ